MEEKQTNNGIVHDVAFDNEVFSIIVIEALIKNLNSLRESFFSFVSPGAEESQNKLEKAFVEAIKKECKNLLGISYEEQKAVTNNKELNQAVMNYAGKAHEVKTILKFIEKVEEVKTILDMDTDEWIECYKKQYEQTITEASSRAVKIGVASAKLGIALTDLMTN